MAFIIESFCNFYVFITTYSLCVFICVTSGAVQDEHSLTMDVLDAATNIDIDENLRQKWSTYSPDDVRCYCNLPVCVSKNYMCKSEGGVCFSEVVDTDFETPAGFRVHDAYKGRHGCLELLETKNKDPRAECQNMPSKRSSYKEQTGSLLLCCFKDLCNHIDSPETQNILNGTRLSATLNDGPNHPPITNSHELNMSASPGYNSNEVWFKAAIIAVPICGIVILLLLIFLAVKILRTDSSFNASSKLGGPYVAHERKSNRDHFDQVHHQTSVKKMPLLIHHQHDLLSGAHTNHCGSDELLKHTAVPLLVQNETGFSQYDKKNEANAKLNMAAHHHHHHHNHPHHHHQQGNEYNLVLTKEMESPLLGLHKSINTSTTSSNNVYRNVNLSLTTPAAPEYVQQQQQQQPAAVTDKLYEKQALSSVINWGNPSPSSSPV